MVPISTHRTIPPRKALTNPLMKLWSSIIPS
jgi:hypothetical protein